MGLMGEWRHVKSQIGPYCKYLHRDDWPCPEEQMRLELESLRAEVRCALEVLPGLPWMAQQILSAALGEEKQPVERFLHDPTCPAVQYPPLDCDCKGKRPPWQTALGEDA